MAGERNKFKREGEGERGREGGREGGRERERDAHTHTHTHTGERQTDIQRQGEGRRGVSLLKQLQIIYTYTWSNAY